MNSEALLYVWHSRLRRGDKFAIKLAALSALLLFSMSGWTGENTPAPVVFSNSLKDLPPDSSTTDLTADEANNTMEFMVALKMRDTAGLQARIARGEIISPEEMAEKYYPLQADHQAVVDWLTGQGFTITTNDSTRLGIFVSGPAHQIQKSLNTRMAKVKVNGNTHIEAVTAPSLPAALATPVLGVNGLQPHIQPRKHSHELPTQPKPKSMTTPYQPAFLPSEILKAYNGNALGLNGAGQTIGIVIDTFPKTTDLTTFWSEAGVNQTLSNITLIQVVSGPLAQPSGEESLDAEWTSGIASGAKVRVYATKDLSFLHIDQGYAAIINDLPSQPSLRQVSCSFGASETLVSGTQMDTDKSYFMSMVASGVNVFISSGDSGYNPGNTIQVETPTNDPFVTSVGGTSLFMNSSGAVTNETAWSGHSPQSGTGGGISTYYARPAWQTGSGLPAGSMRCLPDISAPGDPNTGALVVLKGSNAQYGGTSWSAPTWAGFCALINQARAVGGAQSLSQLGPLVYPLMGTSNFRDITSGSNGYSAGPGYDLCTGIGVPNLSNLVTSLSGAAWPLSIALNSGSGQTTTPGATVASAPTFIVKDANNNLVSGVIVTFAANNGGSVSPLSATTNASGIVSVTTWTLGATPAVNTLTATINTTAISAQVTAVGSTPITLSPTTLPNWGLNANGYSQTITASGGVGAKTFAVTSGAIPTGMTLASATGVLSGKPTAVGTFNFTITATDSLGAAGSQAYSIAIYPAPTVNNVQIVVPADPSSVPKYGKVELLVNLTTGSTQVFNPNSSNGGIDLSATFTSPTSTTQTVNGFYDGSSWRIRFAPMQTGAWTFTVKVTDLAGSSTWSGGTFTCVASSYPGFARIDGSYLRFTEGQAQFAVGHNNGWQYDVEQPTMLNMAAQGENLLSFWMNAPWKTPADPEPRCPIENITQGCGTYNQPACAYLDSVVGDAEVNGIYLLPSIWSHGNLRYWNPNNSSDPQNHPWGQGWWSNNGYSAICSATNFFQTTSSGVDTQQWALQKNYYRYILARWGYSRAIVGWVGLVEIEGTTGYGSNGQPSGYTNPAQATAWCGAVRNYFAANDAFRLNSLNKYPIAVSQTDWTAGANTWASGCDIQAVDSYAQQTNSVAVATQIGGDIGSMRGTSRPALIAEFGASSTNFTQYQPTHLHNGIWAGLASGGMMTPLLWCDGGSFPMLTDPTVGAQLRTQLQNLSQFVSGVSYIDATGFTNATISVGTGFNAWSMRLTDRGFGWIQNTAGNVGGQTVTVSGLTAGTYNVFWYDTWNSGATSLSVQPQVITVPSSGTNANKLIATVPTPSPSRADLAFKYFLNSAPTVGTVAAATPNPVTGTTTALSVLGADDAGEANLTYAWSSSGPATVTYSVNNSNAAKSTTATFTKAGSYTFTVTITDACSATTTSSVIVTVNQTPTTITVAPASATVVAGGTQQFSATVKDQFGAIFSPTLTWSVNGGGTIDSTGLFTAGSVAGGPFTVTASAGSASGTAAVSVSAGATKILVETKPDGSGVVVPAQTLNSGSTLTVYAIARDGSNTFVANVAATWSLLSKTGGVIDGDLVVAGDFKSATFNAHVIGTAIIDAAKTGLATTDSGTITVAPGAASTLAVAGYPSPTMAGVSQSFTVMAKDGFGNTVTGYTGTVHFTSSDGTALLPSNYVFLAGDNGVHTFSATLKTSGTQSITATDTSTGSITGTQTNITCNPAGAASFTVTGYPSPTVAGVSHSFSVTAKDSFGNTATGYTGTVHFTSSDGAAVLPANYAFVAGDNGTKTFSATLKTTGTQSITATDTSSGSITGTQFGITCNSSGAVTLVVAGYPSPTTAGVSQSFTVTAKDGFGNTATGYTGTVHFTSSDGAAVLPANYAFVAGDSGTRTFNATLKTTGTQSITATDTSTGSVTGTQSGITCNSSGAVSLVVSGYPSPTTAGVSQIFTVTAKDGFGNTATGYTSTIHFTSSDGAAVLPANYTFVAGDSGTKSFNAALKTAGTQSITATDTSTGSITGTQSGITCSSSGAVTLLVNGYPSPTTAGLAQNFTVTAKDGFGNTATGYTGTVHFSSSDGAAALPANYTFVAGDSGTKTFSATLKTTGTQSITATDTSSGSITGTQSGISCNSSGAVTLVVSGYPSPTTAGVSQTFTVTAKDGFGNTATGYTGTIHFTSSDGTAVLPANYAFVAGDNGTRTFSGTLKTAGTQSITATDTSSSSITGTQSGITCNSSGAVSLIVSGYPSPTTAGGAQSFTVTAKDGFGNTATGYTGTVHFTSSDGTAVLPANYTFATGDKGVQTFSATLKTVGNQSITVTDTSTGSITGTQSGITCNPAGSATLVVAGYTTPTIAGAPHNFTVTAKDGSGNTATGYSGTIHFTSSDSAASLPPDYTFVAGDNGAHIFSVTLNTAGTQSITATDAAIGSITGMQSGITCNPAGAITLAVAGYPSPMVAGAAHNFTVTAKDGFGNTATGYTGTVHFTTSDANAGIPADYTFVAGDSGAHTFSATLNTAGTHSITATDTVIGSITGTQSNIACNPAGAATLVVSGFASPTSAGAAHNFTVTAKDGFGNTATGYTGTVHFTTSDVNAGIPADYTFVAGDSGTHTFSAILNTAGTQAITATDTGNGLITGTQSGITCNPAGAATLIVAGFVSPTIVGASHSFTVTAKDGSGNIVNGYTGTIHFTSFDAVASLPADYTFVAGDNGVHTFSATLNSAGTQSIAATDASIVSITGVQSGVVVNKAASATSIASSINPAPITSAVSITAAVSSVGGTPTGTVTFTVDGVAQAPVNLTAGSATLTSSTFTLGTHLISAAYNGDSNFTSNTSAVLTQTINENTPPTILSPLTADTTTGIVGVPVTFTFGVSDPTSITYTWDFGDGTSGTTASTNMTHTYTVPGTFTVKGTATNAGGQSVSSSMTFIVVSNATVPTDICAGLNPIALKVQTVAAKLFFPGTLKKDSLALKATIALPSGFKSSGQQVQWDIGSIQGSTTLDGKGNGTKSKSTRVSLKFKTTKGTFSGGNGTVSIQLKNQSLTNLALLGVPVLNINSANKTGDAAKMNICMVLTGVQAYQQDGVSGLYKARLNKGATFSAKMK
jgi:hypothetical protein